MIQHELFSLSASAGPLNELEETDLRCVLERLSTISARPRYAFMVLNLIAKVAGASGEAGPYIPDCDGPAPVRDWLCDALTSMAQRKPQRIALVDGIRNELQRAGTLSADAAQARLLMDAEVKKRVRQSGRSNVSRAISELVRAGLLTQHYRGYGVDHQNRGAQRQAVYTITPEARSALGPRSLMTRLSG